jgi:hypothetical protein
MGALPVVNNIIVPELRRMLAEERGQSVTVNELKAFGIKTKYIDEWKVENLVEGIYMDYSMKFIREMKEKE